MTLRMSAVKILSRVLKDGQSLTAALDTGLAPLTNPKDKAFVQALCYGVVRNYQCLDLALSLLIDKPLRNKDTDIKVVLLIGLYQLRTMRVKPHAAVSETVAAVGKKRWAKQMVNAVLRQYLRDQVVIDAKVDSNSLASSCHPLWLLNAIQQDWASESSAIIAQNNLQPPMTLRVNLTKTNPTAYCELLQTHGIAAEPVVFSETAVQLAQPVSVEQLPNFYAGWVSVQDAAAQWAAPLLQLSAGQRVLDLCAAPGGKTAALLENQRHLAELVAVDIDEKRLLRVSENLQRLQLSARLIAADVCDFQQWWDGRCFERILLDAPCSATGVIRRHPDIKLLRRPEDIAVLVQTQQAMLAAAWQMLAPNGILLYATCSILKAENAQQISAFLATQPDSFEIPIIAKWGHPQQAGRQILTGEFGMDGFYYACLGKR